MSRVLALLTPLVAALPGAGLSEADGPDAFRVIGVADTETLPLRSAPARTAAPVAQIPHGTDGLRNFGCQGQPSLAEWSQATDDERASAANNTWCSVSYEGARGWVPGRFLAEGTVLVSDGPSFDCAGTTGEIEELVCASSDLAALDREMAHIYALARTAGDPNLAPFQRGWIKGRNDCWKAETPAVCAEDAYVLRIDELRRDYSQAKAEDPESRSTGPFSYTCNGLEDPLSAVFVQTGATYVALSWSEKRLVLRRAASASGARYEGRDAEGTHEFWTKGEEGLLSLANAEALQCSVQRD